MVGLPYKYTQRYKKTYTYNIAYTNSSHADGYNLKLEHKEFDYKI